MCITIASGPCGGGVPAGPAAACCGGTGLNVGGMDALLLKDHHRKDLPYSTLSPLVFQAAGRGDEVAAGILRWLATCCAQYTACLLRMMGLAPSRRIPVVATGSVFKGTPALMQPFMEEVLAREWPGACLINARFEPKVGGAVMALRQAGSGSWEERLTASAQALGLERLPEKKEKEP